MQTPADDTGRRRESVADAHAAREPPVAAGRRTAATVVAVVVVSGHAAGPQQHVERDGRPSPLDGRQTAAAIVGRHVLPTGGRHNQPVRRDGAESAERHETGLAGRHSDTRARPKDLERALALPPREIIIYIIVSTLLLLRVRTFFRFRSARTTRASR